MTILDHKMKRIMTITKSWGSINFENKRSELYDSFHFIWIFDWGEDETSFEHTTFEIRCMILPIFVLSIFEILDISARGLIYTTKV
jgi:hypothetical protein